MRVHPLLAFLFLSALGCEHDELLAPDPVTQACAGEPAECVSPAELRRCVGGLWQRRACLDLCRSELPSAVAAGCTQPLDGSAACVCHPPGCAADPPVCSGSDSVTRCADGVRGTVTCRELCQQTGEAPLSAGCDFDREQGEERCFCTSEGAPCTGEEWEQCEGAGSLGFCQDGSWTVADCTELCGERKSVGCVFDRARNHGGCLCGQNDAGTG